MMAPEDRAPAIMRRMGFPDTETGPFVTELRAHILRQCREGMVNRSGGTWGPGSEHLTYEERAKAILSMEWAVSQGHTSRVELLDRDVRSLRELKMWVGDEMRRLLCKLRVARTRLLGRNNPYD